MSVKILFDYVAGIAAIVSLILYLRERHERKHQDKRMKQQDERMLYFLHGAKSLVEAMSKRATSTGADWQPLLSQINDMLARLQQPKKKQPERFQRMVE
jgi:hypothetical protein